MKRQTFNKTIPIIIGIFLYSAGLMSGIYAKNIQGFFASLTASPTVSVIMPTYNRADVLSGAIESVLNQSFKDFEFIIIDDGSTDNTAEIIQKYAGKDSRIIPLKNETNSGIVYGLNRGLEKARGKYIARMDDDDISFVGRLERQVRAMEEHPEITLFGTKLGAISYLNTPVPLTSPEIENPKRIEIHTYFSSGIAHPTIMIRHDFLKKKGIRYSEKYKFAEDCALYKDILNAGGLISVVKEPLLKFKVTNDLKRPSKYGNIQYNAFKGVQREKLARLGHVDEHLLGSGREGRDRCTFLEQMQAANKKTRLLDEPTLNEMVKEACPMNIKNSISVSHPYWTDFFVRTGDKLERFSNKDTARIVSETPTSITIKWDKWDSEIYTKKDDKTFVYQKDANGKVKKGG